MPEMTISIQESLLAILIHAPQGSMIVQLSQPDQFHGDFRDIAAAAFTYWKKHHEPPGIHIMDLMARELESGSRRSAVLRQILVSLLGLYEHGRLNTNYIIDELKQHNRQTTLNNAVMRAAEGIRDKRFDDVEAVFAETAKGRPLEINLGSRLDEGLDEFMEFLRNSRSEFNTGIRTLDDRGIVPARGTLTLMIGGKGRGKSWFLTNVGKQGLMMHHKVLHVSLENSMLITKGRYYQALFGAPQWEGRIIVPRLRWDDSGTHVVGITREVVKPEFTMASAEVRAEIETRLELFADRIANLRIIQFPNRTLTIEMLEAHLDLLAEVHDFVPDMLVLDYAKLMKQRSYKAADFRIELGQNTERLRALAIEYDLALVTVDQLTRKGYEEKRAASTHIGEDWSQVATADTVLVHSATRAERQYGLCRMSVDHARGQRDNFTVLLTQSLDLGQFCLSSTILPDNYAEMEPTDQGLPNDEYDDDEDDTPETARGLYEA